MKQLLNIVTLAAALMVAFPATANNNAWIEDAMSAGLPEKSGDGFMPSSGDQIKPEDMLPEASDKEEQMIEDAKNSYGDDSAVLGEAESGSQYLASDGADTKSGEAFAIVNQEIGFETHIEHKIYQHQILYEHDLNSDLNTNYFGIAWHDHKNAVGTSSGGGDGFFRTPVPSGKVRSAIAMFAAPIKFASCDRAQVKITGGTAWVPGCSASGANCERIISSPASSSLYSYSAYDNRYWRWLDGNGNEIKRIEGSEGSINAYGGVLHFARKTMLDQTSLATMRNKLGVRKVEASGICNHPSPSDDPYYVQSLPNCDDASLSHGDECGKVERTEVNYEQNVFADMDLEGQLETMMEDCTITEEEVSQTVSWTETENEFCERSQATSFAGCTLTHNIDVSQQTVWQDGQQVTNTYVSDSWDGTARCENLVANVSQYESMCSYTTDYTQPSCRTINGVTICEGDDLYSQLTAGPGGYGNKLTPSIAISDVNCDPQTGTVNYDGTQMQLEPFNTCTGYEGNNRCQKVSTECVTTADTALGAWCSEVEEVYECDVESSRQTTEIRTKMVCGNQEFYCADGSCLDQQDRAASEGFGQAAAMLSAVQGISSHTECEDPTNADTCLVFNGEAQACRKGRGKFQDLWNCCDLSGGEDQLEEGNYIEEILENGAQQIFIGAAVDSFFNAAASVLSFFVPCNDDEMALATSMELDAVVYMGSYCGKHLDLGFSKTCIRKDRSYCAWPTMLGRVIMQQAKPMVGGGFGHKRDPDCTGLTVEQLRDLDWSQIDLDSWANKLMETGNLPKSDFGDMGNDPSTWTPDSNPGGTGGTGW